MFNNDYGLMGSMHGLWGIFWMILIGGLVFYGWGRPSTGHRAPRETPHEVLRRRLANGDVTTDQYEERKALLDRDTMNKSLAESKAA